VDNSLTVGGAENKDNNMTNKITGVHTNSLNQHGFSEEPDTSRTALRADKETSTSPVRETGAAFHPEIIARAEEYLGPKMEFPRFQLATYAFTPEALKIPQGHYCNLNRSHNVSVKDLEHSQFLSSVLEPGEHHAIWGASFSCFTEHTEGNGAVFTIIRDEKLFALLGVADDGDHSSVVWDWLMTQYRALRRASLAADFSMTRADVELRRRRIIGDTYGECDFPGHPGTTPWFAYIVNDNEFHEHLIHYPHDTFMLAPLAYRWWFERQAARDREVRENQLESAA